ncbi:MAG: hypothetical protein CMF96_09425 [Candidatus Marinimicrobia bacterium]|nr:hypothetical protein [Candidatus Neomarinimicrobiota bacterium]|tara:strand:+ start:145 stop:768 length:624 start_codon:yes stop_codon:yes gene_type:complete
MITNQKTQNTWVQELNKSIGEIKKKERKLKYFRFLVLFTGCSIFLLIIFILGKSKLQVINPKVNLTKISKPLIIEEKLDSLKIKNLSLQPITKIKTQNKLKEKIDSFSKIDNKSENLQKNDEIYKLNDYKKRNGKHITYYDNGNKWVELNFENDLREGVQFTWHRNGKLKSKLNYVSGKKHGIQKWWQKDGKMLNEKVYINGKWQKK